ncbi:MAG: glycosyltransferase [Lysobacteraceae bacterium]|nr:MAG: glycosyltransferase [Xanthomonadaceae bacterium]
MRGATLILLAWNQWPMTRRCLDSLLATRPYATEVVVVDNGSTDDTLAGLAAYEGRVRVVALAENLGFVRGMNAGIAAARADDDVVLLNNDLVFTQADWLERLRDAAYASPEHGVVGCRLLGPEAEGRINHVGGYIEADELRGQQVEGGPFEREVAQYTTTRRVQGIAFAVAYLRRDCLDRIGALDEAFHSYYEDTDYCLRAADAGIASVVAGAVTLRHDQHGSTQDDGGFRRRLVEASRATFAARWQARMRASQRGNVLWQGTTRSPDAHAHLARSFVRRLDARGLRMAYAPVALEEPSSEDIRLDLAARRCWPHPADAAVVCAQGGHFAQARGRRRIGIGFGDWERVPREWAESAATLDLLLVPDAFQRAAFLSAGVRVPVEVLAPGVDRDYCHPRVPAPRDPRGRYTFLAVVDELARDAPELLIEAFRAAFGADDHVVLLLLVRPGRDASAIARTLAPRRDPRVRMLAHWAYPWHQRAQLLCAADAYVSVRRGGGWDPFAAEALACGRTLVATDFGSQGALARDHGFAVAARRATDARTGLAWAEPERDALVAALRAAHTQHRTEPLAVLVERADAFARSHDVEASADQLAQRITALAGLPQRMPPPRAHRPAHLQRTPSGELVVLGMHRSGTSGVAGLLARMGVHAGPAEDLLVGPDNPKGHYESARLHMACVRRLEAAGGDWKSPPAHAVPVAVDAFRREAGGVIGQLDMQRPWLLKEPRLCLLARELLPLLTRPLFVHVVRDPRAVAASLVARDGLAPETALALWEHYTRAAFEASRGWPRVLVDYDTLLADPTGATRTLHAELVRLGVDGVALPPDEAVRAWIQPNPRSAPPMPGIALTPAQQALQAAIADRSVLDDDAASASGHARSARARAG